MNSLRQIRENAGLSVSALAEASGVSAVTIHRLEEEEDLAANTRDLVALADALHIQVSVFFVPN